ncbi:Permease of the drug/metabolite transporter (DMT) superfamily [Haloplanus vescus]|uniref:Permease of the drug/metabolite transporter (DMT) superfamily n=1 Tax=Haloplanus vescus TaxID=555874 RepID=A0A1H3W050_9EURY|nr:DMT family transporter [Haloplanus vescus]SDZ80453.1 Permease of the drug/metabolite transporter (DMT) superfamily [Haloplanus vescus]
MTTADRRSLGAFVVASVLFGGTFVAVKAGLDYFPPLLFVALRFDIAAVALLAYAAATTPRGELLPRTPRDVAGVLATGVLAIGLTNALLFVGQTHTTSAVAAIVFSLNPILTPVFAALVLADERLSRRGLAGMALGFVGVALVVNPDPAMLLDLGVGKAILLAGAVAGALGSVLIRWAGGSLSSTARTAWGLPFAAVLCHFLSWTAGESARTITWNTEAILALAYVGLLAGAVAYIAYFGLLDAAGAIRANLVFYAVPVVAALGGWALLGEVVSQLAVGGFVTIFVGFAVLGSESIDVRAALDRLRDRAGDSVDVLDADALDVDDSTCVDIDSD